MARFRRQEVDLLGAMVKTPNREKFALFSNPLVTVPGGIFTRADRIEPLTLSGLRGKKVAVVSNYTAHDVLKENYPDIHLDVVPDVATGLAKASLGMVDAYVENMANATYYARQAGITNLRLAGKTDFDYQWSIGLRKDWPQLQAILNKGLAAISEEERQRIIERYLHIEGITGWRPSRTMIFGMLATALGLILLLVLYWNAMLRRVVRKRTATLHDELAERRKAEESLKDLTSRLEERVQERTAALEQEMAERIRSEATAQASERNFRGIFENVADPIFIADMTGTLLAVNDQACNELGFAREELLGKSIVELDILHDQPETLQAHFCTYAHTASQSFESIHRRKDGSTFPVEINARLIEFNGQQAIIGTARNLTARKTAEEERLNLEKQLLHAQKLESLGVLAGGIAHDFNNILTSVIGNAELALFRLSPESPVRENLQQIEKAAARAADLARQMLAYSGKGNFVIEAIDLNRLVEEMGHMLSVSISKKALLRYNLEPRLPTVMVDATQIRQIIMNLVINASEAIGDRSGVISLSTGCAEMNENYLQDLCLHDQLPEGLYVFLEVSDSGCGMDREVMARMFDPFFTTKFTGRGLGMAAVQGIVRGHKGAIKVYSEPGKGSTFKVLFPASDQPADLFDDTDAVRDWTNTGTVLLVDDEETVRAIGSEMLRAFGFTVLTAGDGREALELFRNADDISLVILDLTMPHMDGEQCFRELRLLDPTIQVIMSSGFSATEVTERFMGKGLAGFLQKPYKLSELRETISRIAVPEKPAAAEGPPAGEKENAPPPT